MSQTHAECYGQMMPDLSRLEYNAPLKGQAFVVEARSQGIGVQELRMTVNAAGWERCLACPDYRTCYDLSMAKLVLHRALRDTI